MMITLQCLMMRKFNGRAWFVVSLLFSLVAVAQAGYLFQDGQRVEVAGFLTPESVAVGPDGRIYVSNINRFNVMGDGSIKAISGNPFDGIVVVNDVATGLNDPKGITFIGSELFVTDVNQVWKVETAGEMAGEKSVFLAPEVFPGGAQFLNDIGADADDNLFMSDSNRGIIFKADPQGNVSIFLNRGLRNPLRGPNGVLVDAEGEISQQAGSLLVVDGQTGNLVAVMPDGSSVQMLASGFGSGDGLAFDVQGNLYISDFSGGRVHRMKPDRTVQIFAQNFMASADLTVDQERGWLVVPNFNGNTVSFLELP